MEVNWLEFDGVEYYLTDEEVDAGYYENDWVKVDFIGNLPCEIRDCPQNQYVEGKVPGTYWD